MKNVSLLYLKQKNPPKPKTNKKPKPIKTRNMLWYCELMVKHLSCPGRGGNETAEQLVCQFLSIPLWDYLQSYLD